MAIGASHLEIRIRGHYLGQAFENIQWYALEGAAFLTAVPVGVGEAFWNDIRTVWRNAMPNIAGFKTEIIRVSEPGLTGQYGDYAVPTAEQQGLRSAGGLGDMLPPYCAAALRLTVGSRITRPGQKRFCGLGEADNIDGVLQSGYITLLNALAPKFAGTVVLGAPVATGALKASIVRLNPVSREIEASQLVTGFLPNAYLSTQNSRKYGRGS